MILTRFSASLALSVIAVYFTLAIIALFGVWVHNFAMWGQNIFLALIFCVPAIPNFSESKRKRFLFWYSLGFIVLYEAYSNAFQSDSWNPVTFWYIWLLLLLPPAINYFGFQTAFKLTASVAEKIETK